MACGTTVGILAMSVCMGVMAQEAKTHATPPQEFIGVYSILRLPNEAQPQPDLKPQPLQGQGPCQYLLHMKNGDWIHVDTARQAGGEAQPRLDCTRKASDLLGQAQVLPRSRARWEKVKLGYATHAAAHHTKPSVSLWKVDTVDSDILSDFQYGFDIRKGDLVMQLFNKGGTSIIWRFVLRRLEN